MARRVPGCAVIIPQVFGWREGPSHLCQKEREVCGHFCCCVSQDVILSAFVGLVFVCSCWSAFSGYFYQVVNLLTRSKCFSELALCVCCHHCCQNKFETSPLCWNSPICSLQDDLQDMTKAHFTPRTCICLYETRCRPAIAVGAHCWKFSYRPLTLVSQKPVCVSKRGPPLLLLSVA